MAAGVRGPGVRGMFTGYWPTLLEDVPDMAFKFAAYESMRGLHRRLSHGRPANVQVGTWSTQRMRLFSYGCFYKWVYETQNKRCQARVWLAAVLALRLREGQLHTGCGYGFAVACRCSAGLVSGHAAAAAVCRRSPGWPAVRRALGAWSLRLRRRPWTALTVAARAQEDFAMGAVAGAFAAAATTPLDVIKTNLMCSAASRPTMLGAARSIAAEGSGAQFFRCAAPPARPSTSVQPLPPWQSTTDACGRAAWAAVGPEQRPRSGGLAARSGVGPRALSNGINSAVFFCFFEALRGAIKRRQGEARHPPTLAPLPASLVLHSCP